jgi:hypothetical protein
MPTGHVVSLACNGYSLKAGRATPLAGIALPSTIAATRQDLILPRGSELHQCARNSPFKLTPSNEGLALSLM